MPNSNILMYTTEDGLTKIEATFENDTVWLSIDQMAELFQRDKSTISRHIKNIFEEGELNRNSVVANFATTQFADKPSCFKAVRQNEQNTTFAFKARLAFGFLTPKAYGKLSSLRD